MDHRDMPLEAYMDIMEDLIQSPSTQTTFLGEEKCHLLRVDVMLEGV
jgi:hypothetical protein